MTLETIRKWCLSLPGTTEDIKWENHLCFSVGGKMYLITSPDELPVTASFKCDPEIFEELTDREGYMQAPYFAKNQWVKVDDISRLNNNDGKLLLKNSYELVFEKLTKKLKEEILSGK